MSATASPWRFLPNLVTLSRALALVALAGLVMTDAPGAATGALALVVYAALSDWLDGWLARRFGWTSDFGKIADALLDKVFVLGALLGPLSLGLVAGPVIAWVGYGVMALREVGITALRLWATRRGVVLPAEGGGKWKTATQLACLLAFYLGMAWVADPQILSVPATWAFRSGPFWLGSGLFYGSVYLALRSGLIYLPRYLAALR